MHTRICCHSFSDKDRVNIMDQINAHNGYDMDGIYESLAVLDNKINQLQTDIAYLDEKINKLPQTHLDDKIKREPILTIRENGLYEISNYDSSKLGHLIGMKGHRINEIKQTYKIYVSIPSNKTQHNIFIWPQDISCNPILIAQGIAKIINILK